MLVFSLACGAASTEPDQPEQPRRRNPWRTRLSRDAHRQRNQRNDRPWSRFLMRGGKFRRNRQQWPCPPQAGPTRLLTRFRRMTSPKARTVPTRQSPSPEGTAGTGQSGAAEVTAALEASATPETVESHTPLNLLEIFGCPDEYLSGEPNEVGKTHSARCFGSYRIDEAGNIIHLSIQYPVQQEALGQAFLGLPSLESLYLGMPGRCGRPSPGTSPGNRPTNQSEPTASVLSYSERIPQPGR